jgi:hypothetical protein
VEAIPVDQHVGRQTSFDSDSRELKNLVSDYKMPNGNAGFMSIVLLMEAWHFKLQGGHRENPCQKFLIQISPQGTLSVQYDNLLICFDK